MSSDTLRAIGFMVLSMAAFAVNDFFIKQVSGTLPQGQLLVLLAGGCALVFAVACGATGRPLVSAALRHPLVLLRTGCETGATFCYVAALALVPLALASSILQVQPIFVTAGAALWLGERVGWRRWSLVFAGLGGVLLILRPGLSGFQPATLLVVLAALCLALRDLASRRIPAEIASMQLAFWAFGFLWLSAVLLAVAQGVWAPVAPLQLAKIGGAVCGFVAAYVFLMGATRIGEVSAVIPFRYTRLIFAFFLAMVFLGERPDPATIAGVTIVVACGLAAWARERSRA